MLNQDGDRSPGQKEHYSRMPTQVSPMELLTVNARMYHRQECSFRASPRYQAEPLRTTSSNLGVLVPKRGGRAGGMRNVGQVVCLSYQRAVWACEQWSEGCGFSRFRSVLRLQFRQEDSSFRWQWLSSVQWTFYSKRKSIELEQYIAPAISKSFLGELRVIRACERSVSGEKAAPRSNLFL